jgi:hypothetical protein
MGVYTFLNVGDGGRPPEAWYSRDFSRVANATPGDGAGPPLPGELWAAFEPLTRMVAAEEEPLDDFMARDPTDERRLAWERGHAEREPAWQAPAALIASVDVVLAALRADERPFARCAVIDRFYTAAYFEQDLQGLRANLVWAESRGIPRVRLEAG